MKLLRALAPTLLVLSACGRGELVARGPVEIGPTPVEVRFTKPAFAHGPRRELCFEFEKPGDSRHAAKIRATLVTVSGRKEPLEGALDRRGEALVALVGSATPPAGAASGFTTLEYRGVELSSNEPVRLRALFWASGE